MRKLLILFCFIPFALNGQLINIGTTANDGTGDNLRTALGKVNTEVDRIRTYLPNGATPTFPVGGWRLGSITVTSSGLELNILDGALVNATELNYLVGTTSNVQTQLNAKAASSHTHAYEASLGNPASDGYILSSTAAGVRSWVAGGEGGSMIYPASGIAVSSGAGWGTSVVNNSTNWNTAYNHSQAAHQTIVNGTGFVKATGTTLSYDNNSYSTTSHNHTGTYEAANANIQSHIGTTHQTVINGTGFVKASGTSLSFDNNTYTTTAQAQTIASATAKDTADARLASAVEAMPLLPDTVAYTNNATLALTDANKLIFCTKATSIAITIPANATAAIPVGSTINFVQTGAGNIVFKKAAGVNLYSKKDSIATGGIRSWAALYKRGTNNWILYGDIID